MSGSLRRRRVRHEEDISGQFRVTVPDAEELDQLRTRGECIEGDCIPLEIGVMLHLRKLNPCLHPHANPPQNPWIQTTLGGPLKKFIEELGNKLVYVDLVRWEI